MGCHREDMTARRKAYKKRRKHQLAIRKVRFGIPTRQKNSSPVHPPLRN